MALICEGDKEALASLFRRYARVVRGVGYRVLRDTSEADDLVQDIFLLVHRKCTSFDASRGPARFWILQMTYHRALARRRYLNSRHFYTLVDLDDAGAELADVGSISSRYMASGDRLLGRGGFRRAFEDLSENQRRTLQLFFVEGYTLSEIAAKLHQPRGNVKNHYFRGLEKLRKQMVGGKLRSDSAVGHWTASIQGAGALPHTEPHDEFLELCAVSTSDELTQERTEEEASQRDQ